MWRTPVQVILNKIITSSGREPSKAWMPVMGVLSEYGYRYFWSVAVQKLDRGSWDSSTPSNRQTGSSSATVFDTVASCKHGNSIVRLYYTSQINVYCTRFNKINIPISIMSLKNMHCILVWHYNFKKRVNLTRLVFRLIKACKNLKF